MHLVMWKSLAMLKHKKSQMEIMGLAIIIILMGLGLLFVVQYTFKKPLPTVTSAKESILAANFLHTLLNTNTDCQKLLMKEVLQACALGTVINCPDTTSCTYAKNHLKELLEKTLKKWGKKYDFYIQGAQSTNAVKVSNPETQQACKGEKQSKTSILTVTPGFHLSLVLDIC